jgi:hypothetical protein
VYEKRKETADSGDNDHVKTQVPGYESRTSGAKALIDTACYGTAEAVPFVQSFFPQPQATGISVTEGTGQVGNTFVEVEVQRLFGAKEQLLLSSPRAVQIDYRMKEKAGCSRPLFFPTPP